MYRNIAYKINKDKQGEITLWTWDETGKPIVYTCPHDSHLYYEHKNGDYLSMFNKPVKKVEFKNSYERKKWIDNNPDLHIYESLPPQREFLLEKFEGQQEAEDFVKHKLRINVVDVEIAVEREFPHASQAKYPINVITSYDSHLNEYHAFVLSKNPADFNANDPYWADCDNLVFHVEADEKSMLVAYLKWYKNNRPDCWVGYNNLAFDIPYIVNRCYKVLGSEDIVNMCLSPNGTVKPMQRQTRNPSSGQILHIDTYSIDGVSVLDYLILYRNKFKLEKLPSYKLGDVGEYEIGQTKLEYEGSIRNFYKTDFRKFVKYNIIDVRLVKNLDDKLRYIDMTRLLCNIGLCEYETIYSSAPYILGALTLQAHAENKVLLSNNRINKEDLTVKYEGAYVFEPKVGSFRNGISSVDLNSLYPSIQIACNISPETKVGRIIDKQPDGFHIERRNKETTFVPKEKYDAFNKKFITTPNGVVYINHEHRMGIVPAFLKRLKDKRFSVKAEMKKIKDVHKLSYLDCMQYAIKIFINSIYGSLGNKYFDLFDVDCAESVTIGGQHVNRSIADYIKGILGDVIIYGDTDSLYLDIAGLSQHTDWHNEESIKELCSNVDALTKNINIKCNEIVKNDFHSNVKNEVTYSREMVAKSGTFTAKKRYILHVIDDEGKRVDKWKVVGLELKKTELPTPVKDGLSVIMKGSTDEKWDNVTYKEKVLEAWNKYKNLHINDIATYVGYNTEKKSNGFLRMEKGTTGGAKAAHYYNHMIKHMGLLDKYEEIQLGSKFRRVYLYNTNQYGIDVIGYEDKWPKEFDKIFQINYELMFQKSFLKPLKIFREINNWNEFNPTDDVEFDIMNL
jgi:DNA polymerase elongation subunit (family B)